MLIDSEKLKQDIAKVMPSRIEVNLIVDAQPEAIVRCKDCKHWDADEHDCNIKTGWFACGADWYCADGERKEGDGE